MGSKNAPRQIQFLCAIKKVASLDVPRQNAKVARKLHRFGRHRSKICPNPNVLAYSKSSWIGANMNMGDYELKFALGTSSCLSKVAPVVQKKQRITVSMFLSTLQPTALLLKSFRLRLHCYTLLYTKTSLFPFFEKVSQPQKYSHVSKNKMRFARINHWFKSRPNILGSCLFTDTLRSIEIQEMQPIQLITQGLLNAKYQSKLLRIVRLQQI